jgi:RNA polymerase sigma-70 factor, ECF subfamily
MIWRPRGRFRDLIPCLRMAPPVGWFQMGKKQRGHVKKATDEQLMQVVAGGNLDALSELVLRYQSLAWKMAYRFLGDAMEAEDVAQESFLRILEAAPRYRPTATFRTYFYRILTHLCIDRSRKKQPAGIEDIPEAIDQSFGPWESLIERERRVQVRIALDALPPNQKAAMILRHYEGLSYSEIAQILGVTPKAVEGLISRAGTSLQALLSHL